MFGTLVAKEEKKLDVVATELQHVDPFDMEKCMDTTSKELQAQEGVLHGSAY
jgi:hypothetical protein